MSKGKSDKLTFKPYDQGQGELIPPTAEELIAPDHMVRIVSETLDKKDITILLEQYKKDGGASRYHPLMLLKVLIYGYLNNVFSSRQIAKQVRENIYTRWTAGCHQPDFRTINSFRKGKLKAISTALSKDLTVRKENYENHYAQMENRNSYSKTGPHILA